MTMKLLTTNRSSNAASSSFTSKINSTYKLYIFKFYNVNPATDGTSFGFQVNATDTADYNDVTMVTTYFTAYHSEDGTQSTGALAYDSGQDQVGTAFQKISSASLGNGGDESVAGELYLFNPSDTTYVTHFYSESNSYKSDDETMHVFVGGYMNDTTAIDVIQFQMASGNMDAVISMYGVG